MSTSYASSSSSTLVAHADEALYKTVTWRLIPVLLISYIVGYLDRVNVGFAQLQMKESLAFSDAAFGIGAGIFFIGYFLFEVPSNLLLARIGARKTLLRIMVLWGLAASSMVWVTTPTQFYIARFLLGVFEAGFFPGVILYLTYWYPSARRGRVISMFMTATVIASVIAGPLSGATMKYLDGVGGLVGWQWLFLTQGLPAVVLGFVAFFWLQDRPSEAHWLSNAERAKLQSNLEADENTRDGHKHTGWSALLKDPRVYALAFVDFLLIGASYTMVFWIPTLIKGWGVADIFLIGLYSALPSVCGVIGMLLMCRSSDLRKERRWHFFAAVAIAAIGLGLTTLTQGMLYPSLAALCVAVFGIASSTPLFITATTEYLPPKLAAAGIPFITSLGILGGAVSPAVTGMINTRTGNPTYSMYLVMALFLVAGVCFLATLKSARSAVR